MKYMDITKWKKIASEAKRADKYLYKVCNWEEGDKDYNDDVYVSDAWDWGTEWIDSWYDAVEVNGLYELNGKKIHILYKSPRNGVNDNDIFGHDDIINGLHQFGFDDALFLQIDYNHSDFKVSEIEWIVVAVVDGIKKLIIPHRMGYYNPKSEFWYEWSDCGEYFDYHDLVGDNEVPVHDTVDWKRVDDFNVEYLSWYNREYDMENSGYNLGWANMKRIA